MVGDPERGPSLSRSVSEAASILSAITRGGQTTGRTPRTTSAENFDAKLRGAQPFSTGAAADPCRSSATEEKHRRLAQISHRHSNRENRQPKENYENFGRSKEGKVEAKTAKHPSEGRRSTRDSLAAPHAKGRALQKRWL